MTVRDSRFGRPRFVPSSPRSWILLLVVIIVIASRLLSPRDARQPGKPPHEVPLESTVIHVKRVVDGDTLLLDGGERVRLLGVDTPETKLPDTPPEPFGPEASAFTTKVASGKMVRLEFDKERFDQYGRTLAYVYVDDLFLNEELIRQGLSAAQTQYYYRSDMKNRFVKAEQEAREHRLGIWSLSDASKQKLRRPPRAHTRN